MAIWLLVSVALFTALGLGTAVAAEAMGVELDRYLAGRAAGDVGVVSGRVYAERRRPLDPERPLPSTRILLVPNSEVFVRRLEDLKRGSRESANAFRGAAPAMRRAKDEYESALWQAGAPQLAVAVATAPDGSFRVPDLPAGSWLLVGWYGQTVHTSAPKRTKKEQGLYSPGRRVIGFDAVQIWLRPITVGRGESEPIELTDRNVWFSGVEEDTMLDAGG
ncbi:MAG TPA: hypothetical protein VGU22_12895 [Methylomirabilota bacterium]|nr:hypothetical protein [Methylomirabilota bacterium]